MHEKIFHDTVHGDIFVPPLFCKLIIDSISFQRLRRIEQTSMRSLYPCARHDRFIHSIGVYYLGRKFIENIEINTKQEQPQLWNEINIYWEKIKESYIIACLLHDIGHSPFSHTFEHYFDIKEPKLTKRLTELIGDDSFGEDIVLFPDPKPHEKTSAYIAYKTYKHEIIELGGDPIFVIRMILGTKFYDPNNQEKKLVNCVIPLLHGTIDVDRLDYACRDQWASGFSSARVNSNRIVSSGLLVDNNNDITFCFNKHAISQLQSLIDIKNYQKTWVFGHHKILYDQKLLIESVDKLASNIAKSPETKEDILSKIFNLDALIDENYSANNSKLYLLSDDDIVFIMKQSIGENPFAKEWLSRKHSRKPLWKTESQYIELFKNIKKINEEKIKEKIKEIEDANSIDLDCFILSASRGIDSILKNEINIFINNNVVDFTTLKYSISYSKNDFDKVYYIFVKEQYISYKDEIIDKIKRIT